MGGDGEGGKGKAKDDYKWARRSGREEKEVREEREVGWVWRAGCVKEGK